MQVVGLDLETRISGELQDLLVSSADYETFLEHLARYSATALSGFADTTCALAVERRRRPASSASSDLQLVPSQILNYKCSSDEEPCLSGLWTGRPLTIPDLAAEPRWRGFMELACSQGLRSALDVPVPTGGGAHAAIRFYSPSVGAFSPECVSWAMSYAAVAAKSLGLALRIDQQTHTAENLRAALESRTTIDLAVGIVMGQNRCSQETASNMLKKVSSTRNVKLRELAAQLVGVLTEKPGTHFEE